MLEKKPKNGDVMDGVLAVGARGFAGVVSPQMRLSRCRFAADCENIDATVWHTAGGALPHVHAPALSLGTCAHHSVTRSNETADGPRSGAGAPAVPVISLSARVRE